MGAFCDTRVLRGVDEAGIAHLYCDADHFG
jgi:hypothetical protein